MYDGGGGAKSRVTCRLLDLPILAGEISLLLATCEDKMLRLAADIWWSHKQLLASF